jgi:uncharacterized phage protein (TIGR01671 family)
MRTLKFRVWCKGTSANINFNHPRWINIEDIILGKYYPFTRLVECDDFVVQQYTGLKDEKGVEIYEGDTVSCQFPGRDLTYNGVVEFSDKYAHIGIRIVDGVVNAPDVPKTLCSFFTNEGEPLIEVTGNVFGRWAITHKKD